MREGKGKWVNSNGVIYEGNCSYILVQVSSKKILNMDLENKNMLQANLSKENFSKVFGKKEHYMTKIIAVYKWELNEKILHSHL